MAGGLWEYVMGLMKPSTNTGEPSVGYSSSYNTGFTGKLYDGQAYTGIRALPSKKYYDLYTYGTSYTDYTRGKIGDVTAELKPVSSSNTTWNGDYAGFVYSHIPVFLRGGGCSATPNAGVFVFGSDYGRAVSNGSFRAVVTVL